MSRKLTTLLTGLYVMSAMNEITNPYDDLPEMRYNGSKQPKRKTQLNKKQKKARAAAKRAKQARKRGR